MPDSAPLQLEPMALLVGRVQEGERAAESELCRRFSGAVHAFAWRRLRAHDAVQEFVQDVLLRLIEAVRAGSVVEPARIGGFVLGICKNLSLERVRQRERRAELWEQYGHVFPVEQVDERTPSYEVMKLEDCLVQLSERAREVVRCSYIEGLSHGEVAQRLEISEANARVLRHRTLNALRECLTRETPWRAT